MVFQDATEAATKVRIFRRSIRAETKDLLPAQVTSPADVLRVEPGHLFIWDAHNMPAGISNPSRTQPHRLHRAIVTLDPDRDHPLERADREES